MLIPKDICNVARVAARDETRYAIHGVKLERNGKGPRAIATDGKRALIVSWQEPDASETHSPLHDVRKDGDFAALVDAQSLEDAGKAVKCPKSDPSINGYIALNESGADSDGNYRYAALAKTLRVTGGMSAVDGTFPRCDEVIPDTGRPGITLGVNANLLIGLLQAMVKATGEECVRVQIGDPRQAIRIDSVAFDSGNGPSYKIPADVQATGVLMPVTL